MSDINKRSERIASAIYLITSFFNDEEPLKWKMRSLSTNIVSTSVRMKDTFSPNVERSKSEIHSAVSEMMSHLAVAKNSGLVSDVNHDLISGEFTKYLSSLNRSLDVSEMLKIGNAGEQVDQIETVQPALVSNTETQAVKDKNQAPVQVRGLTQHPVSTGLLDDFDAQKQPSKERMSREFGAVSVKKNSRQSVIIGLLKRKKEIMIKDVSPLIAGVSEKTIQRELLAMVDQGILKKTGEKRWSKYSLAHP